LYSKKQISIPWPEFFVLYNGKDPFSDNVVIKLSDLFEKPGDLGLPEKTRPLLELEVKVININEGRNEAVASRCKELAEYSAFMGKIRDFNNEFGNLEKAIREAVKYCQRHDILNRFLEIHGSEVLNMILTEWNTEDAIAFARKEGREEGREEGNKAIVLNALAEGASIQFIQKITGLDIETIQKINGNR